MPKDVTDQLKRASRGGFLCVERAHDWVSCVCIKGLSLAQSEAP